MPSGVRTMYPGESGIASEDINCRCIVEYVDATPEEIIEMNADENDEKLDFTGEKGYNKDEPIEIQSDEQIRSWIKNHSKRLNIEKYKEHKPGSGRYINGKSQIILSEKETQDLILKFAGTGELRKDRKGRWTKKEFIYADKYIGIVDNEKTRYFSISYKNEKWVHIVPRREAWTW